MTHTEVIERISELLRAVETLRADKPIGPATAETVRATGLRLIDAYLEDAAAGRRTSKHPTNV